MSVRKLSLMKPGETGVVVKINGKGNVKQRLIDMGIVRGTRVKIVKYAPMGDPIEIQLKSFELALRKSEAETIDVDMQEEDA